MDRFRRSLAPRRLLLLGGAAVTVLVLFLLYRLNWETGFEAAGRPTAAVDGLGGGRVSGGSSASSWPGPAGDERPPHRYEHADDFLPLIRRLPEMANLTLPAAAAPCDWSATELTQYPYGRTEHYITSPPAESEVDQMRSQWQRFVQEGLVPYNATNAAPFAGRGIVVVGGRPNTLKRVGVLIRALRQLGSRVPVELHYWGAEEMDPATEQALYAEFGHELFAMNDLSGLHNLYFSRLAYNDFTRLNYQLKTAALLNSRFAEPLLLDADNMPVSDPASLWASAAYREYGSVFWPDIQRAHRENPAWAATNAPCRRDDYEIESGQLLVDKRRFFYHLQLADWFIAQPAFERLLLGDKDTFRFAWAALRTRNGRPRKWVTSVGAMLPRPASDGNGRGAGPVFDYCGHTFAQHHPDTGDVAFMHGGALKTYGGPLLRRLRAGLNNPHNIVTTDDGAVFRHFKRSAVDEDWARVEYGVRVRWLNATYMYDAMPAADGVPAPAPLPPSQTEALVLCVDFANVPARDFRDLLPDFEARFEAAGGLWMIDAEYRAGVH